MQNLVRGETRVFRETNKTSSQLAGCPDDINGASPRDRQPCYVASRQKFRRCATPPYSGVPYRSLHQLCCSYRATDRPRPLNGILELDTDSNGRGTRRERRRAYTTRGVLSLSLSSNEIEK